MNHITSSKIQAEVGLSAQDFAPFQEFISAELVGLCSQPCQLRSIEAVRLALQHL